MENKKIQSRESQFFQKEDAYMRAEKRLKAVKGFYWHAFWYVVVNIFLIFVIARNNENFWHFGTFSTAIFWGIGLGFHALGVFGKHLFFSRSWEERKIKEYMDKEKRHWE